MQSRKKKKLEEIILEHCSFDEHLTLYNGESSSKR